MHIAIRSEVAVELVAGEVAPNNDHDQYRSATVTMTMTIIITNTRTNQHQHQRHQHTSTDCWFWCWYAHRETDIGAVTLVTKKQANKTARLRTPVHGFTSHL